MLLQRKNFVVQHPSNPFWGGWADMIAKTESTMFREGMRRRIVYGQVQLLP